jgi:hypothetical protein
MHVLDLCPVHFICAKDGHLGRRRLSTCDDNMVEDRPRSGRYDALLAGAAI